ncbi:MAG: ATP-binding cassette domain-containing protein [Verrucomicrobiales bacterium]|nr:ATP-binding cassette domain-containing protein [Verrucomicrobiales bacterium]
MTPPASNPSQGVTVDVVGVRKSFRGVEVLRGIDLHVKRGEVFVLMGPSGSGKTVLLRQIMGLDRPDAGEVRVEGVPVHDEGARDRVRMAMVFQSAALLNSLTVAENVGLYLSEHRRQPADVIARIVREKLDLVGLQGTEDKMPSELSGGMKKRVAIARALVMEPQLIVYDEPTSELDPLRSVTIGREILALNHRLGVTSVVVTHDRDLACGVANRIAFMAEGQVRFLGTPTELRASSDPLIREFLTIDFDENRRPLEIS